MHRINSNSNLFPTRKIQTFTYEFAARQRLSNLMLDFVIFELLKAPYDRESVLRTSFYNSKSSTRHKQRQSKQYETNSSRPPFGYYIRDGTDSPRNYSALAI